MEIKANLGKPPEIRKPPKFREPGLCCNDFKLRNLIPMRGLPQLSISFLLESLLGSLGLLALKVLGVVDKEWDKYRVAFVIQGKPHYVEEDERTVNTKEFRGISLHGQPQQSGRPWIGLEHTNKANKRSRYNYMEKAIKIYN